MPSKKKKYNARFPAGRIKKMMQTDEEIGKVAQAVPVIISRTLELFVESLLTKAMQVTNARNAKTLTPSHMKQCILSENKFDFLKDLVKSIPDVSTVEEEGGGPMLNSNNTSGLPSNSTTKTFPGFHFQSDRKLSDSSRSYSSISQNSTEEDAVFTPTVSKTSTSLFPKFYNEIPIGIESQINDTNKIIVRTPVIQHTGGSSSSSSISSNNKQNKTNKIETKLTNDSNKSSEDEDEEEQEQITTTREKSVNGLISKPAIIETEIDEDYDT